MWGDRNLGMCLFLFVLFLSSICWIESVYSSKFSEYGASGKIVSSEAGTTTFRVEVEERMFDISVIGEGIKSLAFDKEQKAIALENNGTHGTIEILIPKELLDGEFTVMTDDQQRIDFARSETATHSTLLLEKSADVEVIVIYGTTVIPEFPVFVILILFAGIIALVLTKNHMFRTG
jgi:hypothetical protein